eukprot:1145730-Pelagomonas_calceolata.AAC.5
MASNLHQSCKQQSDDEWFLDGMKWWTVWVMTASFRWTVPTFQTLGPTPHTKLPSLRGHREGKIRYLKQFSGLGTKHELLRCALPNLNTRERLSPIGIATLIHADPHLALPKQRFNTNKCSTTFGKRKDG